MKYDMATPTRCQWCGCDRQDHTHPDEVEALNGRLWDAVRDGPPITCGDCYDCTANPDAWNPPDVQQRPHYTPQGTTPFGAGVVRDLSDA